MLIGGRTVVVVIVEAGLADRHDRGRCAGTQFVEGGRNVGRRSFGLVRMDADRGKQSVPLGGAERALAVVYVAPDRDDRFHAGSTRTVDRCGAIVVILLIVHVCVRVDHVFRISVEREDSAALGGERNVPVKSFRSVAAAAFNLAKPLVGDASNFDVDQMREDMAACIEGRGGDVAIRQRATAIGARYASLTTPQAARSFSKCSPASM